MLENLNIRLYFKTLAQVAARLLLLGPALGGCVEKYEPDVISSPQRYLVVDGLINLRGVSTVRLSYTRSLTAAASPVETKASVAILDEAGTRYALAEQATPGTYVSTALTLSPAHHYQLRLRTAAGREYASDLVAAKLTPAIDQLSWAAERNGVQLYLDTHDAANATRYYRWTYQETWEIRTPNYSELEYVNGVIQHRNQDIQHCWVTTNSTPIVQSSTERLSQDVVARFPLVLLPPNSEKLRFKYSILAQQYAQTAEEFAYWDKLRKNTESLGTLFDPLPTQLAGNVHCLSDASELVLGYVGASSMEEKRFFIDRSEFPPDVRFLTGYEKCDLNDTVLVNQVSSTTFNATLLPLHEAYDPKTGQFIGYSRSFAFCADCRYRGTTVKPSYWP